MRSGIQRDWRRILHADAFSYLVYLRPWPKRLKNTHRPSVFPVSTLPLFGRQVYNSTMENLSTIDSILAAKHSLPGALLPILHDIQEALGYIPPDAVASIAGALNLSRAEVHGVITYYHYFRQTPPGRHVLRVCRAEACQSLGCEALAQHVQTALGCGFHATSADGAVTLEPVYCLGQCAAGPNMQIDETTLHARMTPEKFDMLLADLRNRP